MERRLESGYRVGDRQDGQLQTARTSRAARHYCGKGGGSVGGDYPSNGNQPLAGVDGYKQLGQLRRET
eukprot:7087270-Pyramimonas_sp.AAC.1